MMHESRSLDISATHTLHFTSRVLDPANELLSDAVHSTLGPQGGVLIAVDDGFAAANPDATPMVSASLARHIGSDRIAAEILHVPGGERAKNDRDVLDHILRAIDGAGLCRKSCVVAIGGGAVLDAVGYAASIAHRGVPIVRLPTTTLAQADSGAGVKNGVNALGKKNFLGTFAVPAAVINDTGFLETLDQRTWRCGFSEAVKVALLKDTSLFERIEAAAANIHARDPAISEEIIRRAACLHFLHITEGGDPFEIKAARPLDFGHWAAHRLEAMTGFELHHGEAVAIGIAIDTLYAVRIGLLDSHAADRVLAALESLGFHLSHPALADRLALLAGIREFREHLGGELTVTLVRGIGEPHDVHEIDETAMNNAIDALLERHGPASPATATAAETSE